MNAVNREVAGGSVGKESNCKAGDTGLMLGSEQSSGEGNDNPLLYSCLENPTDRGAWRAYSPEGHKELDMTESLKHHQ